MIDTDHAPDPLVACAERRTYWARKTQAARAASPWAKNLSSAARELGVSPSYLHKMENGTCDPSPKICIAVAVLYDFSPREMLERLGAVDSAKAILEAAGIRCRQAEEPKDV